MDSIIESHSELLRIVESYIVEDLTQSEYGRKDIPSVEQIFRAAIYKESRQLDYREPDFHQ